MELLDVYDKNRIKTGGAVERGNPLNKGEYRLVVHICLFNSNGEMLIQQRQPFKKGWPNMWDITVGGSVVQGETSQEAVQRELFEELGIDLDLSNTRPKLTVNFNEGFNDIYTVEKDISIDDLTLQYEEVQNAKWATEQEILSMIEAGDFIPYQKNLIRLLFDMRKQYGCFTRKE